MAKSPENKELLKLAAKAAKISIDYSKFNGGGWNNDGFDLSGDAVLDWHNGVSWNPLTDDGDAFRLAAKLNLYVDFSGSTSFVRRSIVERAAAIGRRL